MFYNLINTINLHKQFNKKIIKTKIKTNEFGVINILIKLKIIKFIKKYNKFLFILYLNDKKHAPFKQIKNLYKPSQKKKIKIKILKKIILKKRILLILSTNKGVKTSFEAVKLNLGGIVLINLFN